MMNALIVSPARAGSTSLRETLNELDGVMFHGELLGANRILGISAKYKGSRPSAEDRKIDRQRFLALLSPPPRTDLVGFKLLLPHFFHAPNAFFVDNYLQGRPRVVFLWRRNLMARFRSECLHRLNAGATSFEKISKMQSIEARVDAQLQIDMARYVIRMMKGYGAEIEIWEYEKLFADSHEMDRLLEFLQRSDRNVKIRGEPSAKLGEGGASEVKAKLMFERDYPEFTDVPASIL